MPNILHLTAENADELLNIGAYGANAVIRLQTSATETGTYADVSGAGSTPTTALVSGTRAYTGYDPNGTSSSWYRTRYENVGATRVSDWTTAFQVGGEEAGQLCSLYDVREQLDLRDATGATITTEDENILEAIRAVSRQIEGYCRRWLSPRPSSGTTTFTFNVPTAVRTFHIAKGIASLTQVEVAPYTNAAYLVVPTADWYADPPSAERDVGWPATKITISDYPTGGVYYFYPGMRTLRITGALGWSETSPDVARIAATLTVALLREKGASGGDSFTINLDGSRTFERALSSRDRMTLDFYRHRVVG